MKLKRCRLDNIAMTIGLTIIIAIGLGLTLQQLMNAGLELIGLPQGKDPLYDEARFYMGLLPAKVATLVDALDTIPDTEQPAVIAAAARPQIHIDVLDGPLSDLVNSTDRMTSVLRQQIGLFFAAPRSVVAAPRNQQNTGRLDGVMGLGETGMRVEVSLKNGHWLLFTTNVPTPPADSVRPNIPAPASRRGSLLLPFSSCSSRC
ncbi:MAG: hypothetical protein WA417_16600 [Stellaceae bacterium]